MSEILKDSVKINLFDRIIIKIGNVVSVFYFFAVLITVFEVFTRYALNAPTIWVYETTVLLVGISMLYGGSYCMANDGHIKVSFIRDAMPEKLRKINDFIVAFLTFIFTVSLIYASWIMFKKAFWTPLGVFRLERSGSAWNSPMPAIVKAALMFVVILMCIQAFIQLIKATKILFTKRVRA